MENQQARALNRNSAMVTTNKPILVVTDNEAFLKEISGRLNKFLPNGISIKNCRYSEAELHLGRPLPSVLLLDLISPLEPILALIQKIQSAPHSIRIVGAGQPPEVSSLMKLIKMGVKDFLSVPVDDEEVKELIHHLNASPSDGETRKHIKEKEAKVITFYSPKGGAGVTLLAANLAVTLATYHNSKVLACDFAPQCGDISTYLNLAPQYTARDIIDNSQVLDNSFLDACLVTHSSGVKVLAAPTENQDALNPDNLNALKSIFSLLKESFDIIIVDGSHLDPALLQYILSASAMIFLVGSPDVVSLKGMVRFFTKLRSMLYETGKIKVLINRHNSKSEIDANQFEKMTRHPISCYLPNNFALCIEAVNTGQPLIRIHEKSDLSKKIAELADLVVDFLNHGSENISRSTASSGAKPGREPSKKGIFR